MRRGERRELFCALACALDGAGTSGEIQLLPFGKVESKNGVFTVDAASIEAVVAAFAREQNDLVVDYEHQTLKGVTAPAAGWIKELIDKGERGLWAKVEWTAQAAQYIKNKEYRYLSPVVLLKSRKVVALHSAALTNTPAIDGMQPLANKLGEEYEVNEFMQRLAKLLGLAETAGEEEIAAAVEKAVQVAAQQVVANKAVLELLGLKEDAQTEDVKSAIAGLQNPCGYVKAEEFQALKEKLALKERDELVALALKSGKVAPAQKAWAESYAAKDAEGFKTYLKDAPVVVPLKEIAGGAESRAQEMNEVQLSINKVFGIAEEDLKKFA